MDRDESLFRLRWFQAITRISMDYPGFWAALAELLHRRATRRRHTGGVVISELPETREVSTQVFSAPRRTRRGEQRAPPTTREVACQTDSEPKAPSASSSEGVPLAWEDLLGWVRPSAEPRSTPSRPTTESGSTSPTGAEEAWSPGSETRTLGKESCWNCEATDHFAYECPEPRRRQFCFRCGRPGVTVRTCPECGDAWRAEGPYIKGKGHPGPQPPRRRSGPPGTLKM